MVSKLGDLLSYVEWVFGFNLFLVWGRGLSTLLLGDQMAVLASDVVCVRFWLLRRPTPRARICVGVCTFAAPAPPNSVGS